jgi:hypothetical protein
MTDDLFDDPHPRYGLAPDNRRYRFPAPPGVEPAASWRRTTNLIKAFSDQYALQQWLERMTLLGLLANDGLLFDELATSGVEAMAPDVQRKALEMFAAQARTAVGGDKGARKGAARHSVLEHWMFAGEVIGHRRIRLQFEQLLEILDAKGFDLIPGTSERFVFHPIAGGVVGRQDARFLCRRTGQEGPADLKCGKVDEKTGRRFWTYQEYAAQLFIYDSAPWTWEGPLDDDGRWVAKAPGNYVGRPGGAVEGERAGILLHMPGNGAPEVVEVSLEYGRRVAEIARDATEHRALGKHAGGICPA